MNIELVSPIFEVPGNSSRFFEKRDESVTQPVGRVQLAWQRQDPYLFNAQFEPSLISHDQNYCTSVVDINGVIQIPTLAYLRDRVLAHLRANATVIDIGCGQGEFVESLRAGGISATGYDPVLRRGAPHLLQQYWQPEIDQGADLYVMRCVLPHLQDPWSFLNRIAASSPDSFVLVEFQRLEWILAEVVWYQLSHDHVNTFSLNDFVSRYEVASEGTFSNGEWGWVLFKPSTLRPTEEQACGVVEQIDSVFDNRRHALLGAAAIGRPLAVWGAAGKGIVLADALTCAGVEGLTVIDADPCRWGLYLEPTGLQVMPPNDLSNHLARETLILVCNPNHLEAVQNHVGSSWDVVIPRELAT